MKEVKISDLCSKYETPFYLYFEDDLKRNFENIRNSFEERYSKTRIAYSVKNCFIPGVIKCLKSFNPLFEVTSLNEMRILKEKCSVNLGNCIFTNIFKSDDAMDYAIEKRINYYAIDSSFDFQKLREKAKEKGKNLDVLVRVNPSLEIKDSIFASSVPWSKTGAEIEANHQDCAEKLIKKASDAEGLNLIGVHGHIGSQIDDLNYYKGFINSIGDFLEKIKNKYGIEMEVIDLGGGYPVNYNPQTETLSVEDITEVITERINKLSSDPRLIVEAGRFITASAGSLVTKVVGKKFNSNVGEILVLDASMYNHLLDSVLAEWFYPIEKLSQSKSSKRDFHIVGSTNDSLDHLDPPTNDVCPHCGREIDRKRERKLPSVEKGDTILIKKAGAYTTCFNNNYCLIPYPRVIMVTSRNEVTEIRKRESKEEIFSLFE